MKLVKDNYTNKILILIWLSSLIIGGGQIRLIGEIQSSMIDLQLSMVDLESDIKSISNDTESIEKEFGRKFSLMTHNLYSICKGTGGRGCESSMRWVKKEFK